MSRLHIEHAITDYDTWREAFDRFAEMRSTLGVVRAEVARPIDDEHFIVIDLDFVSTDAASKFLAFLRQTVWSTPENSPGLDGEPRTIIVVVVP